MGPEGVAGFLAADVASCGQLDVALVDLFR